MENLGGLFTGWKGRFIMEGIFENFLSNEEILEHESLSENLDNVDLLKDSLTFSSEY